MFDFSKVFHVSQSVRLKWKVVDGRNRVTFYVKLSVIGLDEAGNLSVVGGTTATQTEENACYRESVRDWFEKYINFLERKENEPLFTFYCRCVPTTSTEIIELAKQDALIKECQAYQRSS